MFSSRGGCGLAGGVAGGVTCYYYSSKDGLVKLWDLHTQHCFQTLVSHHREVWSFQLVGGATAEEELPYLIVASGDSELKLYQLTLQGIQEAKVCIICIPPTTIMYMLCIGASCCRGDWFCDSVVQ